MRRSLALAFEAALLAFLLFVFFAVAAVVSGVAQPPPGPAAVSGSGAEGAGGGAIALLLFCVLVSAAFTWAIARSSKRGWRLAGAVFLAFFGLGTLMPQMESAVFLGAQLPAGFVGRLFVMGAIVAALFAPSAVLILRRRAPGPGRAALAEAPARRAPLDWGWRLTLLAVVYVVVYFAAGYFIAYRNPELVAFYRDTDPGSFLAQIHKVWTGAPWLFALQLLRGVLWVACVIPVILWFAGGRLELGFLIASLYTVWAAMLLAPNPYMPDAVRFTHLLETVPSNFAYGFLVGALTWRGAR